MENKVVARGLCYLGLRVEIEGDNKAVARGFYYFNHIQYWASIRRVEWNINILTWDVGII